MSEIVLSQAVRASLLALRATADRLEAARANMASGRRVAGPLDGPAAYFIAAGLNGRAGGLAGLLDSMALAGNTVEAANAGGEAIVRLLEIARAGLREIETSPAGTFAVTPAQITGTTAIAADDPATVTGTQAIPPDTAAALVGSGAALAPDAVAQTASSGVNYGTTGSLLLLSLLVGESITVNGETYNFTLLSTGQTLRNFIDSVPGLSAEIVGGDLAITGNDAETAIAISYSSGLVGMLTGLAQGVTEPTNLLTQGAVAQGETLTLQVGAKPQTVVTFGTGAGEVATLAGLDVALAGVTGATASVDQANGDISVAALYTGDEIVIGGTADATAFGIAAGVTQPTNTALGGLAGALAVTFDGMSDSIVFGPDDGAGEVDNRVKLEARFADLSANGDTGAQFWLDADGRVQIAAAHAGAELILDGDAAVLAALGFTSGQTASPTNATLGPLADAGETLVVETERGADTLSFGTGAGEIATLAQLQAAIAAPLPASGAQAEVIPGNFLRIIAPDDDALALGGSNAGAAAAVLGLALSAPPRHTLVAANATRAAGQAAYLALLDQIDQAARDSHHAGVNLLQGDDLRVLFNETGSSAVTVQGTRLDSSGLGLVPPAGDDFQTQDGVETALLDIDAGIAAVRQRLGTLQSRAVVVDAGRAFSARLIETLETGAAGLTVADLNAEAARVLALRARLDLGSSALALAGVADRGVLRLFA